MNARGFWKLGDVSDDELVGRLRELCARSAWTEAQIVAHLAELEARGLHQRKGQSLFAYCQKQLGLSENEAHYRIQAARMARKYPMIFELLEQRKIHLTALAQIRHHISPENHVELLHEVAGKTKEQILRLLAGRAPRPDALSRIRKLPVREGQLPAGPTGVLEPLTADTYRLELHTSAALREKLELAADLMSHANPARDLAVVVERALDALIDKLQKRRFGLTNQPRARKSNQLASLGPRKNVSPEPIETALPEPGSTLTVQVTQKLRRPWSLDGESRRDHIPNWLKRALVARDGLGCTYVDADGVRCGCRAFLQIHHEQAWSKQGPDTLKNLRLICARHNALLNEQEFGAEHVRQAIARRRMARAAGSADEHARVAKQA